MRKEVKEIIKLTAKELFLSLFDVTAAGISVFDSRNMYRKSIRDYLSERSIDRSSFSQKVYYLKKMGLINSYLEGREKYIELTTKGLESINQAVFSQMKIKRPDKWDGLFRVIIFDIPEDKKSLRDSLRRKIEHIGFRLIQKSVFAYPFECKREIDAICYYYGVRRYLKYMIAEIIEGEDEIINYFIDSKVMTLSDLDTK